MSGKKAPDYYHDAVTQEVTIYYDGEKITLQKSYKTEASGLAALRYYHQHQQELIP